MDNWVGNSAEALKVLHPCRVLRYMGCDLIYCFLKTMTGLQALPLGVRPGGREQECRMGSCDMHKASRGLAYTRRSGVR